MNLISASLLMFILLTVIAFSKPRDSRFFSSSQKNIQWLKAKGKCELCKVSLVPYKGRQNSAEYDHKKSFKHGGKTIQSNCGLLCKKCNRLKGAKSFNY